MNNQINTIKDNNSGLGADKIRGYAAQKFIMIRRQLLALCLKPITSRIDNNK